MVTPKHVAILGLGPSVGQYLALARGLGGRHKVADETWGINSLGNVFECDRVFHMDDVRIQEIRAAARPQSNIAGMLEWMRKHPGPIYTSRAHPDYPGLVEFPLEDVVNELRFPYFNSTAAYAVAFAIFIGVERISLYGIDFTYPNAHQAEKGRACVEFWMGVAAARGIALRMPQTSTLMDACAPIEERVYGYDTVHLSIERDEGGQAVVGFTERENLPTADEIEQRYCHEKHPNRLVSGD